MCILIYNIIILYISLHILQLPSSVRLPGNLSEPTAQKLQENKIEKIDILWPSSPIHILKA